MWCTRLCFEWDKDQLLLCTAVSTAGIYIYRRGLPGCYSVVRRDLSSSSQPQISNRDWASEGNVLCMTGRLHIQRPTSKLCPSLLRYAFVIAFTVLVAVI
jgi:hypothetical protein